MEPSQEQEPQAPAFSYRLSQPNEDYKEAVIEKSGITVKFTLLEVEQHEATLAKLAKETEAQIELEKAKMANIEHFHPEVLQMSGELLTAAALYKESKTYVEKAEPKLTEIHQAMQEYAAEKDTIMKTLGFVPTSSDAKENQ
jgi:hypothetical protein